MVLIVIKKVVHCLYAHKSNLDELYLYLDAFGCECVKDSLEYAEKMNILYDVVKYNLESLSVSLIYCPTWNTLNEPIVEGSYTFIFTPDLPFMRVKYRRDGKRVYHNKWQFVSKDYTGFSVEEAKKRTKLWNSIPNIKKLKSKIGNKDFWYCLLEENGIDV